MLPFAWKTLLPLNLPEVPMVLPLVLLSAALAADPNTPHPHQGVLSHYSGAPPVLTLTAEEQARLAEGKVVKRQVKNPDGKSGRGVAIQDIHADPDTVWAHITDFNHYPQMVENVYACDIVSTRGEHIFVHFIIGSMGVKAEYWIDHTYRPDQGWLTWTLDYSKTSDLDDSVGYWRVEALPDRPGWTRVAYSVQVQVSGWVPDFIVSMVSDSGLTKATAWVKRESEKGAP